ncbi:ATPase component of ABC transporters with duplicated ATPase domain [Sphaerochaeta pleomorpha str. Grapes]|uniref:Probable ATP-binding protein YbiT n=1 Tax=Sphaerochaeta pleomorpha (strain ATCC BAA-1885 / DSM 22778 / Grapes) TaxID=158190 RepID=G8QXX8_SPHPG|nr:ABC-F family ATP-binding cassette domain-containing protein [Sphaerochaeta pleomorpha]AEV28483.1 ATPase component of ABC transporters with duplicated ATPase domain [Sphaerochaeta pleomorpha str. Grapes]
MATLQVQNVHLAFADRDILDDISFTLTEKSRSALCGGNGSGKSTLLKVIAGLMQADSISISSTKDLRIAYLPQSDIVFDAGTVYSEVEKGFSRFSLLLEEKSELENRLALCTEDENTQRLLFRLHEIDEALLDGGFYGRKEQIEQILAGLGFPSSDFSRQCLEFSGGWQMRIALAKVLVEHPTVMFLDEPTNYLDIEARYWLKNYLKVYDGGVMIVSHDQNFLDETINEVFELFNGKLTRYSGNYSQYLVQREQEIAQLEATFRQQQEQMEKTEQFVERFRYKATKSKQVQSRIKQMEKIKVVEVPSHLKQLSFSFPPSPHSGNDVVIVENLNKHYGEQTIFKDFSMLVKKGERLAVTGRNGAGKSTLLRMLCNADNQYEGVIRLGSGVCTGYFAQDTEKTLNPELSVLDEVSSIAATADLPKMRNYLGSFLFSGDDVFKSVSVLSGGERSRLALLKILLHPANLLILDEPTNHLDINAKQMLLEALKKYDGTMIFVSHDAYFIEHIATRILYLTNDNPPEFFDGDYSYFSYKLEQKEAVEVKNQSFGNTTEEMATSALSYKETNKKRNRLTSLKRQSEQILLENEKIEAVIEQLSEQMGMIENYSDAKKITSLIEKKQARQEELEESEERWFLLCDEIELLEAELA